MKLSTQHLVIWTAAVSGIAYLIYRQQKKTTTQSVATNSDSSFSNASGIASPTIKGIGSSPVVNKNSRYYKDGYQDGYNTCLAEYGKKPLSPVIRPALETNSFDYKAGYFTGHALCEKLLNGAHAGGGMGMTANGIGMGGRVPTSIGGNNIGGIRMTTGFSNNR